MREPDPPRVHGRDHRGKDPATGEYVGSDPARLIIDSTANVGEEQGVGSHSATSGLALVADGSGGSMWTDISSYVTPFKPLTQHMKTTDTLTGPGGVGATVSWYDSTHYDTLLDFTNPLAPAPLVNGWYEMSYNLLVSDLTPDDLVTASFELVPPAGYVPTVTAGGIAGSNGAVGVSLSLPTLHCTTSDYLAVFVDATLAGGGAITYQAFFYISLLLPGDP